MSKSWSPRELYLADLVSQNSIRNTSWVIGEERVDNHLAKDRYPELSFLVDNFDKIYQEYQNDPEALVLLDEIESKICRIENAITGGAEKASTYYDNLSTDIVCRWFEGKLDPDFYYADENNRLFTEYICERIESKLTEHSKGESAMAQYTDRTDDLFDEIMKRGDQPKDRKVLNYLDGSNSRKEVLRLFETMDGNLFLYGDIPQKGASNVPHFVGEGICRLMNKEPDRVFVNTSSYDNLKLSDVAEAVDKLYSKGEKGKTVAAMKQTELELC